MTMKILLDFDGTCARVADFTCAVMTALGHPLTASDLSHYDSVRTTPERERAFWAAYDIMDSFPRVREALEPYDENTVAVLTYLIGRYPSIEVVTANDRQAFLGIAQWFRKNLGDAGWRIAVHTTGRRGPNKATLGYDVLIDDAPSLAAHCPIVRRWRSWLEVPELLARVAAAKEAGRIVGPVLLLANARWNEDVQDKGDL